LVALQAEALAADIGDHLEQRSRPENLERLVLAGQLRDAAIEVLEPVHNGPDPARVGACEQLGIDMMGLGDPADSAAEGEAALPVRLALPAALHFVGEAVEPVGDARR